MRGAKGVCSDGILDGRLLKELGFDFIVGDIPPEREEGDVEASEDT